MQIFCSAKVLFPWAILAIGAMYPNDAAFAQSFGWSVTAQPALRIGRESGPSDYLFQRIVAVRGLPDGRVLCVAARVDLRTAVRVNIVESCRHLCRTIGQSSTLVHNVPHPAIERQISASRIRQSM